MEDQQTVQMFHNPSAMPTMDSQKDVKRFTGDGTPFLKVPKLLEVQEVYVGSTALPLTEEVTVPIDTSHKNFRTDIHEIVKLSADDTGMPVLLRSVRSNDGIWQAGCPIFVKGVWDDGKKKAATEE